MYSDGKHWIAVASPNSDTACLAVIVKNNYNYGKNSRNRMGNT